MNFNGTSTVAIRDSHNVGSITDSGTGNYIVNLSVAVANVNGVAAVGGDGYNCVTTHNSTSAISLQNLAANIITHSKAKNASLQVIGHEDHLTIIVEDDGVGFNPNDKNGGLGLNLIEKRALLFDGKVEIDSTASKGTTIIIDLPYKNPV